MSDAPPTKKRKQREVFSCAECRRLKLRCDRQVPCLNCVRRNCATICPNGTRESARDTAREATRGPAGHGTASVDEYQRPIDDLERLLSEQGIPRPSWDGGSRQSSTRPSVSVERDRPPMDNRQGASTGQQTSTSIALMDRDQPRMDHRQSGSSGDGNSGRRDDPLPFSERTHFSSVAGPSEPRNVDHAPSPQAAATTSSTTSHVRTSTHGEDQSYGTLIISQGGRSKYLGPTAGSEWLKDQETHEAAGSAGASRPSSPSAEARPAHRGPMFPFSSAFHPPTTSDILAAIPPRSECSVLVDSYYRYFAWHYDVVPRAVLQPMIERMYAHKSHARDRRIDYQEIALVFMVLAMGVLRNLELAPNDPAAEDYLAVAKTCLAKGDFLDNTTLSGIRTLHIMAHYHLETEKGRNGDSAWPLWGLAMRLIQAMGLHRDGARWGLPDDVVEDRRRVFWESNAADVLQANCFSRPCSIYPKYIDTAMPLELDDVGVERVGFYTKKFEISTIAAAVLDLTMTPTPQPYSAVMELHERLCAFQRDIPFHLRCRTALHALPSVYADVDAANRDSPDVNRRDLHLTLQQFTLALNVSECFLFLHRPHFAKVIGEQLEDPAQSAQGLSYLTCVERCNVVLALAAGLHELYPNVCSRYWFIWHHAFNSVVCMGTLILRNPQSALAPLALMQIDSAITLFTSALQINKAKRMIRNLQWMLDLRARAQRELERRGSSHTPPRNLADVDDHELGLIGWRTRLVERATGAAGGRAAAEDAPLPETGPSPNTQLNNTIAMALQQHFAVDRGVLDVSPRLDDESMTAVLNQFWEPMAQSLPLDSNIANWFSWDPAAPHM